MPHYYAVLFLCKKSKKLKPFIGREHTSHTLNYQHIPGKRVTACNNIFILYTVAHLHVIYIIVSPVKTFHIIRRPEVHDHGLFLHKVFYR